MQAVRQDLGNMYRPALICQAMSGHTKPIQATPWIRGSRLHSEFLPSLVKQKNRIFKNYFEIFFLFEFRLEHIPADLVVAEVVLLALIFSIRSDQSAGSGTDSTGTSVIIAIYKIT